MSSSYWISAFEIMIKYNLIKPLDPKTLSIEFLSFYGNAYMDYFLLKYGNASESFLQEYKYLSNEHITFIVNSIRSDGEK
jgi:hypothetical protein